MGINIKTKEQIDRIKEGGHLLAQVLDEVIKNVRSGISTADLDKIAEDLIYKFGGKPSFKNYYPEGFKKPFPASLCTSINNEIVHGIPSKHRILKDGDIISLDVGMLYKGCYTDMAKTVGVGKISEIAQSLIDVTKKCLDLAIEVIKPGNSVQDIGRVIEDFVSQTNFSIVRGLVGHGVGNAIWEEPQIPNYIMEGTDKIIFQPNMVIAVEPMINQGSYDLKFLDDGWTIATADGKLSAHFEHTIIVTDKGCEIATI